MGFLETVRNFFSDLKPTSGFNPFRSAAFGVVSGVSFVVSGVASVGSGIMSAVSGIYNSVKAFVTVTVPQFFKNRWQNLVAKSPDATNEFEEELSHEETPELPRYEGENPLLESVEEELVEALKTPELPENDGKNFLTEERVISVCLVAAEAELELVEAPKTPELRQEEAVVEVAAQRPDALANESFSRFSLPAFQRARRGEKASANNPEATKFKKGNSFSKLKKPFGL